MFYISSEFIIFNLLLFCIQSLQIMMNLNYLSRLKIWEKHSLQYDQLVSYLKFIVSIISRI